MRTLFFIMAAIALLCYSTSCKKVEVIKEDPDWANLEKYAALNEALDIPAEGEHRVVFMGNSITEGWPYHDSTYFANPSYINRGISGQTTPQMLIRFKPDVIALQPSVVVILAGINDIAGNTGPMTIDQISDNIQSMTELAKIHDIQVVLSSCMPAYDFPWRPGLNPAPKVIALNKKIKAYADQKNHIYLDYFSAVVDERNGMKAEYSNDEVHPTKEGYQVMAPLADAAIAEAIRKINL